MRYIAFTLGTLLIIFLSTKGFSQYGTGYTQEGVASYYHDKINITKTASGEVFDNTQLVGSHQHIPFDSRVKVTNLINGKSVIIRINNRGPFAYGRIIDISKAAAKKIDLTSMGTANVKIKVISDPKGNVIADKSDETKRNVKITATRATDYASYTAGQTYSQWGTPKFPKGYGMQVAYFEVLEKAQSFCKELRNKGLKDTIYLQIGWSNTLNKKVFRIIVGSSEEGDNLTTVKEAIAKIGYQSFKKPHFK